MNARLYKVTLRRTKIEEATVEFILDPYTEGVSLDRVAAAHVPETGWTDVGTEIRHTDITSEPVVVEVKSS